MDDRERVLRKLITVNVRVEVLKRTISYKNLPSDIHASLSSQLESEEHSLKALREEVGAALISLHPESTICDAISRVMLHRLMNRRDVGILKEVSLLTPFSIFKGRVDIALVPLSSQGDSVNTVTIYVPGQKEEEHLLDCAAFEVNP